MIIMSITQKKRRIPSNLKKRVPKPSELKSKDTSTTSEPQSKKTEPKKKTVDAGSELPNKKKSTSKGVKDNGTKKKVEPKPKPSKPREAGTSKEVEKPTIPAGGERETSRPRPLDSRADIPQVEGQLTYDQLKDMSYTARVDLHRKLNKGEEDFIQLIKPDLLPKGMQMRKKEAEIREIISKKPSRDSKVYYCPYCMDYMKFMYHAYTGYDKCISCGMTSKDFHIAGDNELFNK